MADKTVMDEQRYFVINGRRWRKTDPSIPQTLSKQLVNELMSARRAVKAAKAAQDPAAMSLARARVSDAKNSLGERGHPWWETPTKQSLELRLAATIRCLLNSRDEQKTMCPSEAARVVGGDHWREIMPQAVETAWKLEKEGWLCVTQQGEPVRNGATGPIRLRRCQRRVP